MAFPFNAKAGEQIARKIINKNFCMAVLIRRSVAGHYCSLTGLAGGTVGLSIPTG